MTNIENCSPIVLNGDVANDSSINIKSSDSVLTDKSNPETKSNIANNLAPISFEFRSKALIAQLDAVYDQLLNEESEHWNEQYFESLRQRYADIFKLLEGFLATQLNILIDKNQLCTASQPCKLCLRIRRIPGCEQATSETISYLCDHERIYSALEELNEPDWSRLIASCQKITESLCQFVIILFSGILSLQDTDAKSQPTRSVVTSPRSIAKSKTPKGSPRNRAPVPMSQSTNLHQNSSCGTIQFLTAFEDAITSLFNAANTNESITFVATVAGAGVNKCYAGIESEITVHIHPIAAKQNSSDIAQFGDVHGIIEYTHIDLVATGTKVVEAKENCPGLFKLSYTLRSAGRYNLSITYEGGHIAGSPYTLHCSVPPESYSPPTYSSTRREKSPGSTVSKNSRVSTGQTIRQTDRQRTNPRSTLSSSRSNRSAAAPSRTCSIHGDMSIASKKTSSNSTTYSVRNTHTANNAFNSTGSRFKVGVIPEAAETTLVDEDLCFQIGSRGRHPGQFVNLQGIHCDARGSGDIWVCDSSAQNIQKFSGVSGRMELRFGKPGRKVGDVQRPTGITLSRDSESVLVADYDTKVVNVFNAASGEYMTRFGAGKLVGPKGVAVVDGRVVVVDNKGHQCCVFDPAGKCIGVVGSSNRSKQWSFSGPHYIAVNESVRRVYVTDFHSHTVKVFDLNMEFLFEWGAHGSAPGQFNAPTGITLDSQGNVLVADWGNCRIQIFDTTGTFLGYVNTSNTLYGPQDLSITANDHVIVADSGNHCYKIYSYSI